ncbi:MAG TPA: SMC-Scp complex subunit ScpB [Candidatus Thermoplasmatota archaeon]|nr:SMC-Scp complex subunit ScpB [Candidatus Thermoplasmatota archaeon]
MAPGLNPRLVVEAALFSAGKPLLVEEIADSTGLSKKEVTQAVQALRKEYAERDTSLEVGQAGLKWAMQVRREYAGNVTKLAPMEIAPKLLRTLALIAYHQPVLQSDLQEMVGAKVYDHIAELKELGLVRKRQHERSYLITTTERFPEYFGIAAKDPEDIRRFLADKVGIKLPETDKKGNKKLSTFNAGEGAAPVAAASAEPAPAAPSGAASGSENP